MHVPYTLNTLRIYTYFNLFYFFTSDQSRFILFRLHMYFIFLVTWKKEITMPSFPIF